MNLREDDGAEATVISQILIIGITAAIVFVAATFAFTAVDSAIRQSDHAAAGLSLRGTMDRLHALDQQGVGASALVDLPQQGEVRFASFAPLGQSQDRLVVTGAPSGITFDGLTDGDNSFDVCGGPDGLVVTITWHWNADTTPRPPHTAGAACGGGTAMTTPRALDGVVSIRVHDGDDVHAAAVIADLPLIAVTSGSRSDTAVASLLGNLVMNGPDQVTADLHVQAGDAVAMRIWALEGTSFSTGGSRARLQVDVADQEWLAQVGNITTVSATVVGPHANGILTLYERHDGQRSGDTVTFDATRLDVHGTLMDGALAR